MVRSKNDHNYMTIYMSRSKIIIYDGVIYDEVIYDEAIYDEVICDGIIGHLCDERLHL